MARCAWLARWDCVEALAEPLVCHACLKGAVVNETRAFDELATIIAGENAFAAKIEILSLKSLAVYDSLFRWPFGAHFPFAFSPSAFLEPASPMPKLVARLRIPAAVRFSRAAIAAEFSPDAARARNRSSSLEVQVERLPITSLPSGPARPTGGWPRGGRASPLLAAPIIRSNCRALAS